MADVGAAPRPPKTCPRSHSIRHAAWHDAHDGRVPDALVALRTELSFHERAVPLVPDSIVADRYGSVIGFTATGGDEVAELFVAEEARPAARPAACCVPPRRS